MRFSISTLGCKVNQYESQEIVNILVSRGHSHVKTGDGCDICIINTCAVTAESTRKSRQAVRRLAMREPDALIAVCGCYSQLEPEAAALLGADIIGGSGGKEEFALELERVYDERTANTTGTSYALGTSVDANIVNPSQNTKAPDKDKDKDKDKQNGRTRALLKIQDGCDNFCAYCVIPYARGRSRSIQPELVSKNARQIKAAGYKEIIITGIEISSYGKDLVSKSAVSLSFAKDSHSFGKDLSSCVAAPPSCGKESSFIKEDIVSVENDLKDGGMTLINSDLTLKKNALTLIDAVREISCSAPDLRLRLGSLDPGKISEKMIEELREIPDLCPHFHLSLQSGCDETLRRMGRRYDTQHVLEIIEGLRRHFGDCFIASDLIVGFPGETDEEFNQTIEFIIAAKFTAMHIFPFSSRAGTRAAEMPDHVQKQLRHERAVIANELAKNLSLEFKRSQIGKIADVLFEQKQEGLWTGYSGNYLEVKALSGGERNMRCKIQLTALENDVLLGDILTVI